MVYIFALRNYESYVLYCACNHRASKLQGALKKFGGKKETITIHG
jgi:hypothetical protein